MIPTQIIYKEKIINSKEEMAESFNDIFINIVNMVEERIPKGKAKLNDCLKQPNVKNMFLDLVDEVEIASIMFEHLLEFKLSCQIEGRTIFPLFDSVVMYVSMVRSWC